MTNSNSTSAYTAAQVREALRCGRVNFPDLPLLVAAALSLGAYRPRQVKDLVANHILAGEGPRESVWSLTAAVYRHPAVSRQRKLLAAD